MNTMLSSTKFADMLTDLAETVRAMPQGHSIKDREVFISGLVSELNRVAELSEQEEAYRLFMEWMTTSAVDVMSFHINDIDHGYFVAEVRKLTGCTTEQARWAVDLAIPRVMRDRIEAAMSQLDAWNEEGDPRAIHKVRPENYPNAVYRVAPAYNPPEDDIPF